MTSVAEAFLPLHLPGHDMALGSVAMSTAPVLLARGVVQGCDSRGHLVLPDGPVTQSLDAVRDSLYRADLIGPPRSEPMPVRLTPDGEVLGTVDRSAVRALGLWVTKVHVNGLVSLKNDIQGIWLSRRAKTAAWNPDRFDTMVAGGVAAHQTVSQAVQAECWEEAGLPPGTVTGLTPIRRMAVQYVSDRGLHRELLVIHDMDLDPDFSPSCQDGEIAWAQVFGPDDLRQLLKTPSEFKFSSALVCRDLLGRHFANRGSHQGQS